MLLHSRQYSRVPSLPRGHRIFEYLPEKTQTFRPVTRSNEGYRSPLPLLLIVPRGVSGDWRYDAMGNGVFFVPLPLSFSGIEFNQPDRD